MKPNYVAKKSIAAVLSFWSVVLCILVIPLIVLIFRIIAVKKQRIEFYDDKVITYRGLINTSKKQTAFMGVTSTVVNQSLFGHIFNYGNVEIDCVGVWDIDTKYVKNPQELEQYLQTKIIKSSQATQHIHV